jgi:hypothetical protein
MIILLLSHNIPLLRLYTHKTPFYNPLNKKNEKRFSKTKAAT